MRASRPLLRKAPPRAPIDRVRLQPAHKLSLVYDHFSDGQSYC